MAVETNKKVRFEISQVTHDESFSMKAPHSHSFYEIFYLKSGRCSIIIDGEKYTLMPGDIAFLKPESAHQTLYSIGYSSERICLEFSDDYLQGVFNYISPTTLNSAIAYPVRRASTVERHSLDNSFEILLLQKNYKNPYSKEMLNATFMQLIFLVMGCSSNISSSTGESMSTQHYNSNVEKAIEYIHLNYYKKIGLCDLAEALHLNSTYFSKLFKTTTGKGFADYVLEYRIVRTEELLIETQKSITEIALSCGFGNVNYFCEAFKKKNKITPMEFRRIKGNMI